MNARQHVTTTKGCCFRLQGAAAEVSRRCFSCLKGAPPGADHYGVIVRALPTFVAVLLLLAGVASAILVHWLIGLFFVEVGVALLVVDRTVGLRYAVLAHTSDRRPNNPWPPSKIWVAQVVGAAVFGLAVAYVGISAGEPLAVLALLMAVLGGCLLWAIPVLKKRQQRDSRS